MSWFEVDRKGLAKLLADRGKIFLIHELLQNALDTDCKEVLIQLIPDTMRGRYILTVSDDDPDGFKDLRHAYTLFAESEKKADPTKRGRFNFGEKIVLALCEEASIQSTKGMIHFSRKGERTESNYKTSKGSVFCATIPMTKAEYDEVCRGIQQVIIPEGVTVEFNARKLPALTPMRVIPACLPTEIADPEGNLRPTKRVTDVQLFPADSPGWLFEMGIPVVEIQGPWNVNVMQKVPLNLQRDNVRPTYLRDLRVGVLNKMWDMLPKEEVAAPWIGDALGDKKIAHDAVRAIITQRYGDKVVTSDPSDPEAMSRAVANGYTIAGGRSFTKEQWVNIRNAEAIKPAGAVFPTPRPYSSDPEAKAAEFIPANEWTIGMREVARLSHALAWNLMKVEVKVSFTRSPNGFVACYGKGMMEWTGELDFNVNRLGYKWFDQWRENKAQVLDLLIHELGHHYSSNHLSEEYYSALTKLGGKMSVLALTQPELFEADL